MNKYEALHNFFSSFGVKAFEENSVPEEIRTGNMPYITYEVVTSPFDIQNTALSCQIFYKTDSLMKINALTEKLAGALRGGAKLRCDTGYIILYPGTPFAQNRDSGDKTVKAKYITITADYITL